jgi:uncharacterized protein YlxP (DUF503 family)
MDKATFGKALPLLATYKRRQLNEANRRLRPNNELLIKRFSLAIVNQNEEGIRHEALLGQPKLSFPIQGPELFEPAPVEFALRVFRLNQTAKHQVVLATVEFLDFMMHALADQFSHSDTFTQKLKRHFIQTLSRSRFVANTNLHEQDLAPILAAPLVASLLVFFPYESICPSDKNESPMPVATLTIELAIEHAQSLKDRRQVVRSIKDKLRNGFNISVAELDGAAPLWNRATLGIAAIHDSRDYLEGQLKQVEDATERLAAGLGATVLDTQAEFLES